jgi:hypothetical protein
MKLIPLLTIVAGLITGISSSEFAQAQPSSQGQPVQDAYQQYFQAWQEYQDSLFMREDATGFLKTLTPDHVSYDRKGHKTTLRQEKSELAGTFKNISSMEIKSQVGNVRVNGSTATMTVASGESASVWNKHLQMEVHLQAQTIEVKTLRLIKGKWYEASTRETMGKMWLEGKEIPYN